MDRSQILARADAWLTADPDPATAAELRRLIDAGDHAELADRFAGALEFGTAGLRGVLGAGPNRMNRAVVRRTTAGLARYLLAKVPDVTTRGVVVGRDGRTLSPEFAADTASVLAAHGIPALFFPEVVPTPVTAFATLRLGAAGAVMVTASHNPPEYNGYKVYWGNGAQIIPPHDQGIAEEIDRVGPACDVPLLAEAEARARGLWRDLGPDLDEAYLAAILELRPHRLAGDLPIVYTAMHGVGGRWVEAALARAGFSALHVVPEQHQPDGAFPTVRFPNPEEPGAMDLSRALADKVGAELVLANDPDADRLAVIVRDERGLLRALTGNEVGVLLGHYLLTQSPAKPKKPLVITSIVSSPQLGVIAHDLGALYDETLTGFKWIANRALARLESEGADFVFGYEEALGYTAGTVARDKDGVGTALVFADLAAWCRARGTTVLGYLEEIQRRHGLFVAAQRNFTFPGAEGAQVIANILRGFRERPPVRIGELAVVAAHDYLRGESRVGSEVRRLDLPPSNVLAYQLEGGSRVTLRPSGTEPKIKYYFDLKQDLAQGEPLADARARAEGRLLAIQEALLALARDRGHP
ncbi:MAG: phospho-sugar mutase [Myxococcales bacterium]|nr:phospho-sugar mutase [Myxococcales bacterium]